MAATFSVLPSRRRWPDRWVRHALSIVNCKAQSVAVREFNNTRCSSSRNCRSSSARYAHNRREITGRRRRLECIVRHRDGSSIKRSIRRRRRSDMGLASSGNCSRVAKRGSLIPDVLSKTSGATIRRPVFRATRSALLSRCTHKGASVAAPLHGRPGYPTYQSDTGAWRSRPNARNRHRSPNDRSRAAAGCRPMGGPCPRRTLVRGRRCSPADIGDERTGPCNQPV